MSRLIARLVLAMLILPLAGTVFVFSMVILLPGGGQPGLARMLAVWAAVYAFIGIYWMLLWQDMIRWTTERKQRTWAATVLSLVAGVLLGLLVEGVLPAAAEVGALIGGGVPPIVWVLATVLIWRETPAERIARLTAAGTDAVSCPTCGYNLTGMREARCPECGAQYTLDELLTTQPKRDEEKLEGR